MKKNFRMMIVSALRCWGIIGTVMVIVSLLSCKQGHIPNTDMPELRNDTGVNISPSTPPVPPPPPAAPENLVKNADFSKLTDDTSNYKDYWTDKKRPASWNTWASAKNIADVTFTATGGTFTVQAGNTVFAKGGIQQTITLESGVSYTLSVKVKLTNISGGDPKGGCEVKIYDKTEIKYGGTHTITFDVTGSASAKLELLAKGLQNKKVEFSAITLTKK